MGRNDHTADREIKLSCKVSFSWNSCGPSIGNCHDAGQPTEQAHPREGQILWPLNSALAGSTNSTCFLPFPISLIPPSLLRSAVIQGMKRVPLVGESRRKEPPSHFGTLFPSPSSLLFYWSCLGLKTRRILTLNQAGSHPSLNSGLSEGEISKEQIWRQNTDSAANASALASWRLETKINDRCCLHLGGFVGKKSLWTFHISNYESQNQ